MYDTWHPVYYNLSQLGCVDQEKITTAFHVYMELCEVKKLWDVDFHYNSILDLIYLTAKQKKNSESEIYLPWPAMFDLSIGDIENIQNHIGTKQLICVFREGDSTSVYTKFSSGLIKPLSPEETKKKKQKEEKKFKLESEIRRNAPNLVELARSLEEAKKIKFEEENQCIENVE